MRPVRRDELLDYVSYEEQREALRPAVLAHKEARRIALGDDLVFCFETTQTVRYQVQEMMRVERIVREADIQHELATYNELLAPSGGLGATLLIGVPDAQERDEKLRALLGLPEFLYLELEDGRQVRPTFDPRQVGERRLSSVQYLKFDCGGQAPVALGADHPVLTARTVLTPAQRAALAEDLRAG